MYKNQYGASKLFNVLAVKNILRREADETWCPTENYQILLPTTDANGCTKGKNTKYLNAYTPSERVSAFLLYKPYGDLKHQVVNRGTVVNANVLYVLWVAVKHLLFQVDWIVWDFVIYYAISCGISLYMYCFLAWLFLLWRYALLYLHWSEILDAEALELVVWYQLAFHRHFISTVVK